MCPKLANRNLRIIVKEVTIAEPVAAGSTSSSQASYETARSISSGDLDRPTGENETEIETDTCSTRSRISTQDSSATVVKRIRHRNFTF